MTIALIVAMAANRVIGRDNQLPWRLPPDLRRFKQLTMGHTLVLGRRTFESIGRPLPGRDIVVVTRQPDYRPDGVRIAHSVDEALARPASDVIFIGGGAGIFRETLGRAGRLHITRLAAAFEGDTLFPEYDERDWRLVGREHHAPGDGAPFGYSFEVYERENRSPFP